LGEAGLRICAVFISRYFAFFVVEGFFSASLCVSARAASPISQVIWSRRRADSPLALPAFILRILSIHVNQAFWRVSF
jgi:hypothetical protein